MYSSISPELPPSELGGDRQVWTPEKDQMLAVAVAQVASKKEPINWHKVAAQLPGRTNKNCRKRWHYKVANDFRKGPWTADEDDRLRAAVQKHGTKWSKVAPDVKTRNGDQCWKRWNDSLDPRINHSPWSDQEDAVLIQKVEEMGTSWSEIVSRHLPGRTALGAKNRHVLLQRRAMHGLYGRPSVKRKQPGGPADNMGTPPAGMPMFNMAFDDFYGSHQTSVDWSRYDMNGCISWDTTTPNPQGHLAPNPPLGGSPSMGNNYTMSTGMTGISNDSLVAPDERFLDIPIPSPFDMQGMMDSNLDFNLLGLEDCVSTIHKDNVPQSRFPSYLGR